MATIKQTSEGFKVSDNHGVIAWYYLDEYTNPGACLHDAKQSENYYTEYPRAEAWKYKPAHLSA